MQQEISLYWPVFICSMEIMFAIIFVVGNQGFSNQPGFTDFPNTPGTPILGEYAPSGPPPPLPYQSEQVGYL